MATDFSKNAQFALERAVKFTKKSKVKLSILHVFREDWLDRFSQWASKSKHGQMMQLKRDAQYSFKKKIKPHLPNIKSNFIVKPGREDETIIKYAKEKKFDFLVIGAHGNYCFHEYFLGTTAESVVKKSPCPILVVKRKPNFLYKNILIPIDFSSASKQTVEFAYAHFPDANLEILHVDDLWYDKITLRSPKYVKEELEDQIDDFLRQCRIDKSNITTKVLGGYPAMAIAREAKKRNFDLVIIGTRGQSKLRYLLIGSVAERVLQEVNTDIIAIPPR